MITAEHDLVCHETWTSHVAIEYRRISMIDRYPVPVACVSLFRWSYTSITVIFIITVLLHMQSSGRKMSPRARNQCCYYFFYFGCALFLLCVIFTLMQCLPWNCYIKYLGCHFGVCFLDWLLKMYADLL